MLGVYCRHSIKVNWSRYRDTGVTDPALSASKSYKSKTNLTHFFLISSSVIPLSRKSCS